MTQPLTIPTPFNDVSELTDNFATRVDETQIMLPYSEPIEEDVWLSFTVLLADGSVALEGTGRSTGAHDNGEEYPPEYRYDVVLDSLQFSGMSEVMFERILQARQSQLEGDPGTGEVDVNQLAAAPEESVEDAAEVSAPAFEVEEEAPAMSAPPADVPTEASSVEPSEPTDAVEALPSEEAASDEATGDDWAPEGGFAESFPTQAVALEAVAPRAAPSAPPVRSAPPPAPQRAAPVAAPARPSPPQRPRGGLPLMHTFDQGVLTRPSSAAGWQPEVTPRPEPAQSSGLFDYQGGLPRPAAPPHPELADEQRVAAAPSPSAPWSAQVSA